MTIKEYTDICLRFAEETRDWSDIDTRFFVTYRGGWVSSCDNAHGGMGVRWAFQKSEDEIRELAPQKYADLIHHELVGLRGEDSETMTAGLERVIKLLEPEHTK